MNTIPCPHCGKPVEISEAIRHQIEAQTTKDLQEKHRLELEEAKKHALEESTKKLKEQFDQQLTSIKEDAAEKDTRIKELITQITEMTKELRESKKEKEEAEMKAQKKLSEEAEKIRLEAQKRAEEEQHTKLLEKDKQLLDAMKQIEEMRRKMQQGSQQTQGEAFELAFEENLQNHYPQDKVMPVAKGVKGADVIQEVWDRTGNFTGKIIFELKNTKTWSELWVDKLKADKRASNADEAVIISEALPPSIKIAGYHNGVWVTSREFVFPLTDSLRARLIHVHIVKNSLKGKDVKMEALYNYLTGTEFKNRIEGIVEAFSNMQGEIEKEKRYFANKWARDEKNIRQVIDSTYGMHGDLKGILAGVVPQIKGLEFLELDSGD
jgi:hypothetical protein